MMGGSFLPKHPLPEATTQFKPILNKITVKPKKYFSVAMIYMIAFHFRSHPTPPFVKAPPFGISGQFFYLYQVPISSVYALYLNGCNDSPNIQPWEDSFS